VEKIQKSGKKAENNQKNVKVQQNSRRTEEQQNRRTTAEQPQNRKMDSPIADTHLALPHLL
jgi:hypothetical protein